MTEAATEISVLVCTHNRAEWLRDLVERVAPETAAAPVELIVVDSASRPDQRAENAAIAGAHANTRFIQLDTPGLSLARNAGLDIACGPWIAILDDDELPPRGWVEEIRHLARRLPDDCAACGGNISPIYPDGLNHDLPRRWLAYLSLIDRPGEFDQGAKPRLPIGHSLVRASALRQAGGFDPRLGRTGTTLLSGEEVLLMHRLMAANWTVWHSDRIDVGHRIPPERLERRWALDRAFWEGISTYRVLAIHDQKELSRLVRQTASKHPFLWLASHICPDRMEFDLRLAFAQGVRHCMTGQAKDERLTRCSPATSL